MEEMEKSINNEDYVDITAQFDESLSWIKNNKVITSDLFNLLDGTRAVEMGNKRLDTSGIKLSEEDVRFDCTKPLTLKEVISIENRLLIALGSWLNNGSLPVTVLSCRYIYALVKNYTHNPGHFSTLEKVSFQDSRIPSPESYDTDSIEYLLVNKVLLTFATGICKFVSFCIYVGQNVLYEEEDLTTRTMDLNFLNEVPTATVMKQITETSTWIANNLKDKERDLLLETNKLIFCMLRLESFLSIPLALFKDNVSSLKECEYLKQTSEVLQDLKKSFEAYTSVPQASFSKFFQTDANNNNIPSDLYSLTHEEAYKSLSNLFSSCWEFLVQLCSLENETQLENFMKFDMEYKVNDNYNVIARGLFQLFLIRDDKSIIGSPVDITTLSMKLAENVVGSRSEIFDPTKWHIQGTDEFIRVSTSEIVERLNTLQSDLEVGIFNDLSIAANNKCRQRQLISKSLLLWDTLQVNFEAFELEIYEKFKIGSDLEGGEISLAASSFIYHKKLDLMLECTLSGFGLDLYKDYETCLIFWYSSYLAQLAYEHVANRVNNILKSKIDFIQVVLPKRIKKLKSGSKKNQLKEEQKKSSESLLPTLEKRFDYSRLYLAPSYDALNRLTDAVRTYIVLLSGFKLVDFTRGPKNSISPPETLFNLRLKPYSSIGVPGVPTFQQFTSSTEITDLTTPGTAREAKALASLVAHKFSESKSKYSELISRLDDPAVAGMFVSDSHKQWYNMLLKTCIMYTLELSVITKILDSQKTQISPQTYTLEITEAYHTYFPRIRIAEK